MTEPSLYERLGGGFKVPQREREDVLGAFAAHKDEVTEGYMAAAGG